jgi:hypothetical protein
MKKPIYSHLTQLPGGMVVNKRIYDYVHNFLFMNPQYSIAELLGLDVSPSFVVGLGDLNMKSFKKLFRAIVKLDM